MKTEMDFLLEEIVEEYDEIKHYNVEKTIHITTLIRWIQTAKTKFTNQNKKL